MKKYLFLCLFLVLGNICQAMIPADLAHPKYAESEDLFVGLENIIPEDLTDFPLVSPVKLLSSPQKFPRIPFAPLADSNPVKRVLFPEDPLDIDTADKIDLAVESPKKARLELPSKVKKTAYDCNECGKSFTNATALTNHINSHKKIKPFACPDCFDTFGQKATLKRHIQKKHPGTELPSEYVAVKYDPSMWPKEKFPYQCAICNKGFTNTKGLESHTIQMKGNLSHIELENEKKSAASIAPVPPVSSADIPETVAKSHETQANTAPIIAAALETIHPSTTKKANIEKRHACTEPGCDKKFARKTTLEDHINWHQGIQPFACPYCDKSFGQKGNCNAHIKTAHEGLDILPSQTSVLCDPSAWPKDKYPHRCATCNKGFARPVGLYHHQRLMQENTAHIQLEEELKKINNTEDLHEINQ